MSVKWFRARGRTKRTRIRAPPKSCPFLARRSERAIPLHARPPSVYAVTGRYSGDGTARVVVAVILENCRRNIRFCRRQADWCCWPENREKPDRGKKPRVDDRRRFAERFPVFPSRRSVRRCIICSCSCGSQRVLSGALRCTRARCIVTARVLCAAVRNVAIHNSGAGLPVVDPVNDPHGCQCGGGGCRRKCKANVFCPKVIARRGPGMDGRTGGDKSSSR